VSYQPFSCNKNDNLRRPPRRTTWETFRKLNKKYLISDSYNIFYFPLFSLLFGILLAFSVLIHAGCDNIPGDKTVARRFIAVRVKEALWQAHWQECVLSMPPQ
jgi:hypothetical protein